MLQLRNRERYGIGLLAILFASLIIHFGVIFPRDAESIFPWSSDAWGHLVKAVYLRDQVTEGNLYPDLFPSWYSGQQLLRYFPPLSYYAIVGLEQITGNIFTAGNLFIFATSLIGGLSMLLFAPRIGMFWAVMGGILFIVFPDNLRVAFAEGNLPRLAATALLPVAFFFLLNVLEQPRNRRHFVGLVVVIGLIVLSHAMMAAIFLMGLGLYALAHWLLCADRVKVGVTAISGLAAGLLVSGWWLFPSLTGGISELDNNAASEAIADFPISVALNPSLRGSDNEIFYVGLVSVLLLLAAFTMWRRLDPWVRALVLVTFFMTLVGSTFIIDFWRAFPGHQLMWPMRFMSFAALGLVLTSVLVARELYRSGGLAERRWMRLGAVAVLALVFIDFQPSLQLVRSTERPAAVQEIADELAVLDGWRVANADLSRLGSAPAMLFTTEGDREQVFGWAFQGSITGPLLARLNQSLTEEYLGFAISRLDRLGADDVVVLPQPGISSNLDTALETDGFHLVGNSGALQLFHRDGSPRAFTVPTTVLGIGGGAENASLLFPQMITGSSWNLDDYSDDFLAQFDLILLSRFTTSDRVGAEARVERLASTGMQFLIDMTGAPESPQTRLPKFLGVYGEPVLQIEQATLITGGVPTELERFNDEEGPWNSVTPQGADETLLEFEYPAARGVVVSRNKYGDGEVKFLGLNLFFHAMRTGDVVATALLEDLIGLPALGTPEDVTHNLRNYVATEGGWSFEIDLSEPGWVLFPMAHHDGTHVYVNGSLVESIGIERLTFARMPAGTSSVEIRSERTGIYTVGAFASILGLLIVLLFIAGIGPARTSRFVRDVTDRSKRILNRPPDGERPVEQA